MRVKGVRVRGVMCEGCGVRVRDVERCGVRVMG